MAYLKLKYVWSDRDRHGNERFYFARRGEKKVRLPGLPGSQDFMRVYKECLGVGSSAKADKSLRWLCEKYFASVHFKQLEQNTQQRKRQSLIEVCEIAGSSGRRVGDAPFDSMTRVHVRAIRDRKAHLPEGANYWVKQLSAMFAWAIKNDLATVNPATGVERLKGSVDGFYTWTEDDVIKFERYWPVGSKPRLAMAIMLYLGVRRSDAVLLGQEHLSMDGLTITFQPFKTRKRGGALTLPVLPELRKILDASELGSSTWLETEFGKPFVAAGFGNTFSEWCDKAGLPKCSSHGLRKAGAVRAAEGGATEHELMALFGWNDAAQARVYTKKAAQGRMAASGSRKMRRAVVPDTPTDTPTGSKAPEIIE